MLSGTVWIPLPLYLFTDKRNMELFEISAYLLFTHWLNNTPPIKKSIRLAIKRTVASTNTTTHFVNTFDLSQPQYNYFVLSFV